MKKVFLICVLLVSTAVCAAAQNRAFSTIDDFLSENGGDFDNRNEIVKLFNQERIRLGDNFEAEVWKYLGEDLAKYYWISSFLIWKDYLQGSKPLPELSFKIKQRGIELIGETEDKKNLGRKITFLRDLAVNSYLSGNREAAINYKNQAVPIYAKYDDIGAYVGATTEFEYCIFDNLEKDASVCQEDEQQKPKEKTINGGILNGKAVSLPAPEYPKEARKERISGEVRLKVLIDTDGTIISAEGFDGNPQLFNAAIEAAKKARFKPAKLSGEPVKVAGVLIYKFVY